MINFIQNYWKALVVFMSFITVVYSLFKSLVNSITLNKIRDNHLAHLKEDIKNLEKTDEKQDKTFEKYQKDEKKFKEEDKKYKEKLIEKIHQINLGINRIERKYDVRRAICNERHESIDKDAK